MLRLLPHTPAVYLCGLAYIGPGWALVNQPSAPCILAWVEMSRYLNLILINLAYRKKKLSLRPEDPNLPPYLHAALQPCIFRSLSASKGSILCLSLLP